VIGSRIAGNRGGQAGKRQPRLAWCQPEQAVVAVGEPPNTKRRVRAGRKRDEKACGLEIFPFWWNQRSPSGRMSCRRHLQDSHPLH